MTFTHLAFAGTLLLATSPGVGGPWASGPGSLTFERACTPEAQRCLEKLEARLNAHGREHDLIGIEQALLELNETDPECALLLWSAGLRGM